MDFNEMQRHNPVRRCGFRFVFNIHLGAILSVGFWYGGIPNLFLIFITPPPKSTPRQCPFIYADASDCFDDAFWFQGAFAVLCKGVQKACCRNTARWMDGCNDGTRLQPRVWTLHCDNYTEYIDMGALNPRIHDSWYVRYYDSRYVVIHDTSLLWLMTLPFPFPFGTASSPFFPSSFPSCFPF